MTAPNPPAGLKRAGEQLWHDLHGAYEGFTPHEIALIAQACRVADRLAELDALIAEGGVLVESASSGDKRANPALVESRMQQVTLARLLAAARLPDSDGLKPQHRQSRGIYAAKRSQRLRGVG